MCWIVKQVWQHARCDIKEHQNSLRHTWKLKYRLEHTVSCRLLLSSPVPIVNYHYFVTAIIGNDSKILTFSSRMRMEYTDFVYEQVSTVGEKKLFELHIK
jgi:hypothetical protein